jgi:hypothetical protein
MWLAAGAVLVGGVVATTLVGRTYANDVDTVCHAEARSGHPLGASMADLTRWVRPSLTTPEGNALFTNIGYAPLATRAGILRREAARVRIGQCPLAESYERLALDADYRSDLQALCSRVSLPDFEGLDDEERLTRIEGLVDAGAKSARTRDVAGRLRRAAPDQRGRVLSEAARETQIFSCDIAKAWSQP